MKVSIVGAAGGIGTELTKYFLSLNPTLVDELSLVTRTKKSHKMLYSLAEDSYTEIPTVNVTVCSNLDCMKKSNVIVFCAGAYVNSTKRKREMLFEQNNELFGAYCKKMNRLAPNSVVFVATNPVSQLIQHNANKSRNVLVGIGVTNDTVRLRKIFERKFGYNEKKLFVIGDHLTTQTITFSQLPEDIAKRLRKEEEEYEKKHQVENMFEYVRAQNYRLLEEGNVKKMFDFVESLPFRFQAVARQRFCHFITKTALSTRNAIAVLFNNFLLGKGTLSAEIATKNYLGLPDSVLGVPIKFEDMKPFPVELNYSNEEMKVLEECSKIYGI